jgi:hypothetical protein
VASDSASIRAIRIPENRLGSGYLVFMPWDTGQC